MLKPVFYTQIRPAIGQTEGEVIRAAHALGYDLVAFEGYSDTDLGMPGNRGAKWAESQKNLCAANEIQNACVVHSEDGDDWPHIIATKESP
ncbi:MAG: hypothetical protein A2075_09155 [Geobacteraceae bacterium GWC2_58_44]|nr:MAG: hypothetical protein A2075_09155 [Geobacteraceae bacterium GWC2_58_44]HBG07681.1 hypothetical protein [Geobacter sp.]